MKKILSVILAIISTISLAFAFGGCGTVEVNGQYYYLKTAYDKGYLNEEDLKSIACDYYEWDPNFEENPYEGMFTSTEELTKKMGEELKQAYLEQIDKYPEGEISSVKIIRYYGTYNGNVVAYLASDSCIYPVIEPETEIGGVIFKDFWAGKFLVYHIN